jgi:hypothetical protein
MHACMQGRYRISEHRARTPGRRRAGKMKLTNKQQVPSSSSFSTHAAHAQSDHMSNFAIAAAGATVHHSSCLYLLLLPLLLLLLLLPNSQDMYFTSCGAESSSFSFGCHRSPADRRGNTV